MKTDIAIIGAGIGGLTTGAFLSKLGYKVTIIEGHNKAGGFCHSFKRIIKNGNTTFPVEISSSVHDFSGLSRNEEISKILIELDINLPIFPHQYSFYFHDDPVINLPLPNESWEHSFYKIFPNEEQSLKEFWTIWKKLAEELYKGGMGAKKVPLNYIGNHFKTVFPSQDYPYMKRYASMNFLDLLDELFLNRRLKKILIAWTTYLSNDSRELKIKDMIVFANYYLTGGKGIVSGSMALASSLEQSIIKNGSTILLKNKILEIKKLNNAYVLSSDKATIQCKQIIFNCDLRMTASLLPNGTKDKVFIENLIKEAHFSTSVFLSYIIFEVDTTTPNETISYIFDQHSFGVAFTQHSEKIWGATLTFLMGEQMMAEWSNVSGDHYHTKKESFGKQLLNIFLKHYKNMVKKILWIEHGTPQTIERFVNVPGGSIYGAKMQNSGLYFQETSEDFYYVGSSTFLGSGVESSMLSGKYVARLIHHQRMKRSVLY